MLIIHVRLLSGRYVATEYDNRDQAEWPPHPMRLYAAAVAAWADSEVHDPAERAALEWWESLGPPEITCSPEEEVARRSIVTHYVPVNDVSVLARNADGYYRQLGTALEDQVAAATEGSAGARAAVKAARAEAKVRATAAALADSGRAPDGAVEVLPERRVKYPRTYPAVTPPSETVVYRWPGAATTQDTVAALDAVLSRIPRLGHSSSPVDVAVLADTDPRSPSDPADAPPQPPTATYVPASGHGDFILRTAGEGQLESLEAAYAAHRGREPRVLASDAHHYRRADTEPSVRRPRSVLDDQRWYVFATDRRLPIVATLGLTRVFRAALMTHSEQPPPGILTGHRDGRPGESTEPSEQPHAAYLALPYVGGEHGDGSIMGLALVLPRTASGADRGAIDAAIGGWLNGGGSLTLGRSGIATFEPVDPADQAHSVRSSTWTQAAYDWSTVTPIALDRHPGRIDAEDRDKREAALEGARESIRQGCLNVGLPVPISVNVRVDPPLRGTRPARAFPPFAVGGGKLRRFLIHADVRFAERVEGPLVLGAGRYFGYGLLRPMSGRRDHL